MEKMTYSSALIYLCEYAITKCHCPHCTSIYIGIMGTYDGEDMMTIILMGIVYRRQFVSNAFIVYILLISINCIMVLNEATETYTRLLHQNSCYVESIVHYW